MERKRTTRQKKKANNAATPHQLVGMANDFTILACKQGDAGRSQKAVLVLRDVMRSVGPADSSDLMACYDWCLDRIGKDEFELAAQTLSDLRKAWEDAQRQSCE